MMTLGDEHHVMCDNDQPSCAFIAITCDVRHVPSSVPVRTFSDWGDPAPGFIEADLVAHGGPTAAGSFVQTLVLTDIAMGWVECAPLLYREQNLLTEVLDEVRKLLPFPLLGFDTDNDTVFMNETVRDYCREFRDCLHTLQALPEE
jgi:hypothetical protein